ncbi:MAG: hypothetical protein LBF97_05580 [Elusimicrobiota bacterium]|nr:hypothetical protein [Elusimicrobiota bacterium]
MKTFRDVIQKEFLYMEAKENISNLLKVFYKINLKITNTENAEEQPEEVPQPNTSAPVQQPVEINPQPQQEPLPLPADTLQQQEPVETELPNPNSAPVPIEQLPVPSVKTKSLKEEDADEDENEEKVTNENEIIRKTEGQINLSKDEIDEIQTIEDLIDMLGDKDNDGDNILDDFSIEVIKTMISPDAAQKASQVINRDDYIFLDILYGRKKDDDNIGFRITKRKKSDTVSSVILKDGDILNTQWNVKIINDELVNLRNSIMK